MNCKYELPQLGQIVVWRRRVRIKGEKRKRSKKNGNENGAMKNAPLRDINSKKIRSDLRVYVRWGKNYSQGVEWSKSGAATRGAQGGKLHLLSLELCEFCSFFLFFLSSVPFFLSFDPFHLDMFLIPQKVLILKKFAPLPLAEILWPPLIEMHNIYSCCLKYSLYSGRVQRECETRRFCFQWK